MAEAAASAHGVQSPVAESPAAVALRAARRRAAAPGGARDRVVALAKLAFPAASLLLLAGLVLLPLRGVQELSFLLSKEAADAAGERLRVTKASYRGTTASGERFEIDADSAVQKTSDVPVVVLEGLSARLDRADGPAVVTAPRGFYFLESGLIEVEGPIEARSGSGYRLDGEAIRVDLERNRVTSARPVSGELPMGSFTAGGFEADLPGERVLLTGGVRMRLFPDRLRMQA
ncbi:LPS export ABC transporter periplasmic protein LptC [Thermaurantiacus tibetensis]|uniref:LPS export ABC transporter periplasmic protein LptC n=1 Tax=Thermaurantiacus tibetensis TaxID=2759035 RepID=UPI00188E9646|nr:LPS export ABC transporter periplasmic protein LptC [Thermaurantiacus tibetensis]